MAVVGVVFAVLCAAACAPRAAVPDARPGGAVDAADPIPPTLDSGAASPDAFVAPGTLLANGYGASSMTTHGGNVYWTNGASVYSIAGGGGLVRTIASWSVPPIAQTIAVDDVYAYLAVNGQTFVFRLADGSQVAPGGPAATAVTLAGGYIYFAGDNGVERSPTGALSYSNVALGNGYAPVAAAGTANKLFWCDRDNTVHVADVASSTISTFAYDQLSCGAIAISGSSLYWVADWTGTSIRSTSLIQEPLSGGPPAVVFSGAARDDVMAADGSDAYLIRYQDNANDFDVLRVSLADGSATPVATGTGIVDAIAIDNANVYWSLDAGTLWRSPK